MSILFHYTVSYFINSSGYDVINSFSDAKVCDFSSIKNILHCMYCTINSMHN